MRKDFYEVDPKAWLFKAALPKNNASGKEESVRQWTLHELIRAYGISICDISLECPVKFGHKTLRADIAVLQCGKPYIIVECKKHSHKEHAGALKQACSYADSIGGSVLRFRPYWTLLPSVKLTVRPSLPDCTACVSPASIA